MTAARAVAAICAKLEEADAGYFGSEEYMKYARWAVAALLARPDILRELAGQAGQSTIPSPIGAPGVRQPVEYFQRRAGLSWDDIDDLIRDHAFVGTDDTDRPYSYVHSGDAADKLWERLAPYAVSVRYADGVEVAADAPTAAELAALRWPHSGGSDGP